MPTHLYWYNAYTIYRNNVVNVPHKFISFILQVNNTKKIYKLLFRDSLLLTFISFAFLSLFQYRPNLEMTRNG